MTVIENYHGPETPLIGRKVVECIGYAYDKRRLALYRLDNGWLGWLPDSALSSDVVSPEKE